MSQARDVIARGEKADAAHAKGTRRWEQDIDTVGECVEGGVFGHTHENEVKSDAEEETEEV